MVPAKPPPRSHVLSGLAVAHCCHFSSRARAASQMSISSEFHATVFGPSCTGRGRWAFIGNEPLICFDLSTFGTNFRNTSLRFSLKNRLLLGLWVCGREARECGQPVGRAFDMLDALQSPFGAVHGLPTRLCSGRSAGMRTRPHIHRLAKASMQTHWLRAHTADCDGGSC